MCEPLMIASAALTAGSMAANQMAQNSVNKARNGAMEAERIRQNRLQQEANALNTQSQDRYKDFQGQEDQRSSQLGDYFKEQIQDIPQQSGPTETVPTSANNIVVNEQNKQGAKAKAYSTQQANALGDLRAFGDLLGETSRLQGRDAAQIGTLGGFMKGSQGVLPLELEAANNKGGGFKTFGDLLSLGSTITGGLAGQAQMENIAKGGDTLFSTAVKAPYTGANAFATARQPTWLGRVTGAGSGWGLSYGGNS